MDDPCRLYDILNSVQKSIGDQLKISDSEIIYFKKWFYIVRHNSKLVNNPVEQVFFKDFFIENEIFYKIDKSTGYNLWVVSN